MILRLAIIGFGNVGQEFARLLGSRRNWLLDSKGLEVEVAGIATRSRGNILSDGAVDLDRALKGLEEHGDLRHYGDESADISPFEMIDGSNADIMIEISPLNIESGRPAIDHISHALESKMHVITANKGPIAFSYDQLESLARSNGVKLRFEGTVMDGTPIFNLVEKTMQGCEIARIEGILNSTYNYVLTEMAKGRSLEDAVKDAQRKGIAEADPSHDLDGWDAAAKITALANVLMGAGSNPRAVERQGIAGLTVEDLTNAARAGRKIKLVAAAERTESEVRTTVGLRDLGPDSVFWAVDGTSSAVTISTDLMGDITILETNPAITQTAYALFSDLLAIAEWMKGDH